MVHPLQAYNVTWTNNKVHIYDAWCGSGKTRAMLEFLAGTSTDSSTRAVIAFPTIKLALEAEVQMRKFMLVDAGVSDNAVKLHFNKNITTMYDLKESHITELREQYEAAPDGKTKDLIKSVLHLAGNRLRSSHNGTRIDDKTFKRLFKARVIITTHTSLLNLALVNLIRGRHTILDESPTGYIEFTEPVSKDEAQVGQRLPGYLSFSDCKAAHFDALHAAGLSGVRELQDGDKVFYAHHVKLSALCSVGGAESVTVLTAFAGGTSVCILNCLEEPDDQYGVIDSPLNEKFKAKANANITWNITEQTASCASSKKCSEKVKPIREEFRDTCVDAFTLVVTHKAYRKFFESTGATVVSVNARGNNSYAHFDKVAIDSITFSSPADAKKYTALLGECKFKMFEEARIGADLLQSVYRTALRDNKPITISAYDPRVKEYMCNYLV